MGRMKRVQELDLDIIRARSLKEVSPERKAHYKDLLSRRLNMVRGLRRWLIIAEIKYEELSEFTRRKVFREKI